LEDELYQMEDTFRNQNRLIQAIQESQEKQAVFDRHSIKVKRNESSKTFYNGHLRKIMRVTEMRVTKTGLWKNFTFLLY